MRADTPEIRELSPSQAFEAALDWWRDAGVDDDYTASATSWLAEPEEKQAVASAKPKKPPEEPKQTPLQRAFESAASDQRVGGLPESFPGTLEIFREWWMSDTSLSSGASTNRVPPRGAADARLMVIVPEPLEEDRDTLVSGAPGKFLDAMLRAMNLPSDQVYIASALPAASALPDYTDLARRGLADVMRVHIELAAPHRVLALGRALAPVFGIEAKDAREAAAYTAGARTLPLMLAPDLAELARSAPRRRNFWNRWLEWTA